MRALAAPALLAGIVVTGASTEARDGGAPATDANLVTALDVSDSIMRHEEWIEFAGMIHAIESNGFLDAVAAGSHGRIGFAVIVWSSGGQPDVIVPWTVIESKRDARRVADALRAARQLYGFDARMGNSDGPAAYRGDDHGSDAPARRTDLSAALEFSADLLRIAPFVAPREVINICGNGADNVRASPAAARDRALAAGMVVNGLAIGATPGIADYYRAYVQGGPGSFVLEVADPEDVAAVMLEKFLRDLNVAHEPSGRLIGLHDGKEQGADHAAPPEVKSEDSWLSDRSSRRPPGDRDNRRPRQHALLQIAGHGTVEAEALDACGFRSAMNKHPAVRGQRAAAHCREDRAGRRRAIGEAYPDTAIDPRLPTLPVLYSAVSSLTPWAVEHPGSQRTAAK